MQRSFASWIPWRGACRAGLAAVLLGLPWPLPAQFAHIPDTPENRLLRIQQEAQVIARILELVDLNAVLSQPHLLPPTVVIQRNIVPAIANARRGRALTLKRGQSLPLHEVTTQGVIVPVEVRNAINALPQDHQGRLDPLAIRKLSRGLTPDYGIIPHNATDLVYQLREHLTRPARVRLTEFAPTVLQRKGVEMGEIELERDRELPLLEVQGNAVRLQVYNSEVEVPIEWTDFAERQGELNRLLDWLNPIPTTAALSLEPLMRPPLRDDDTGAPVARADNYQEDQIIELQIQALERDRRLRILMREYEQEIDDLRGKLRLLRLQHLNLKESLERGDSDRPEAVSEEKQMRLVVKQYRQALIALAVAYRNAAATHLRARRGFEAARYLESARKHIQSQADHPSLAALGLEQLAAIEQDLRTHFSNYLQRKRDLAGLARTDPVVGEAAAEAVRRDFPDLPASELRQLDLILREAHWDEQRRDLWSRMQPALTLGRTDEDGALALLDQIQNQLPREDPELYRTLLGEIRLARRDVRRHHLHKLLPGSRAPADEAAPAPAAAADPGPPLEEQFWLRVGLLAGLVASVALIAGAAGFVLRPRASGEEAAVRELAKHIPPPPGEESAPPGGPAGPTSRT